MASAKQICADARTLAGQLNYSDPNDSEVLRFAEMALQKIGKILHGIDSRIYGQIAALNFNTSATKCEYVASGATWTQSTKTIAKSATFGDIDSGGVIAGYIADGSNNHNFFARVVTAAAGSLVLDRDIGMGQITSPTTLAFLVVSPVTGSPTLSISSLPVGDVEMVAGSAAGNMRLVPLDEFLSITSNPNFDSSGVVTHQGTNLLSAAGSSLTNGLGVVFVFYRRKPRTLVTMDVTVDLPIKYHAVLRDEIAKQLLIRKGIQPPPELKSPLQSLEAQAKLATQHAPLAENK